MAYKTRDLTLVLKLNPGTLEVKTKPGEDFVPALAKGLEIMASEVKKILDFDVPEHAIAAAIASQTEVKKVEISGYAPEISFDGNHYIVTYETTRGRQLGRCLTYSSDELKILKEK